MNLSWSDWDRVVPFLDNVVPQPYLHWALYSRAENFSDNQISSPNKEKHVFQFARNVLDAGQSVLAASPAGPLPGSFDRLVPIPEFALNPCFMSHIKNTGNWLPDPNELPELPDDTVIVGVIDSGIPLGNNRFRDVSGESRILAAWQCLGEWESDGFQQTYLPFGRELYKGGIDELLKEHSGGNLAGYLDEQSFNIATGVVDNEHLFGSRDAAGIFSHGAHVLDAAAGCDPDPEEASGFLDRVKIIAVNIPNSETFGASGTNLDEFMVYAIQRITDLADAIWKKNHPEWNRETPVVEIAGYPLAINLSYGKQAGSKNTLDPFPATLKKFQGNRNDHKLYPANIVMPVGNDNLMRCNAFLEPKRGKILALDWRILPEDQSSNYVEIWTTVTVTNANILDGSAVPLEVAVIPPGHNDKDFEFVAGQVNDFKTLNDVANLYVANLYYEIIPVPDNPNIARIKYTICVAPTLRRSSFLPTAPAGIWTIKVRNNWTEQLQCNLSVQTDQAILPGRPTNLRSYFDDCAYRYYDEDHELVDSYTYSREATTRPQNTDLVKKNVVMSPVRRHGTMNASAAHKMVARVGGYRTSDGEPVPYSATGRGRKPVIDRDGNVTPQDDGTEVYPKFDGDHARAPTASLPTDDGPAHFGILAAGAANGSVVAARGTSFASSQATRCVVETLLVDPDPCKSARKRLFDLAAAEKDNMTTRGQPPVSQYILDIDKAGHWQISSPLSSRVSRSGRGD